MTYLLVIKVKDIEPGQHVNVLVKVEKVEVVFERLRFDGSKVIKAECVVGDDTGIVKFYASNGKCQG